MSAIPFPQRAFPIPAEGTRTAKTRRRLRVVHNTAKPVMSREPHKPKVSPFAAARDALNGPNLGLFLRTLGIGMARTQSWFR